MSVVNCEIDVLARGDPLMLVMTLLVKNERDIVEANLRFHLERGVDHVIVTDNASTDGTRDILSDFARTHPVSVLDEPGDDYSQYRWVTRMARAAVDAHGADWVINNDADEFWAPTAGINLRDSLDGVGADVVMCARRNMVWPFDDAEPPSPWHKRLIYRAAHPVKHAPMIDPLQDALHQPHFLASLPEKAALRGDGLSSVRQGNHGASYDRTVTTKTGPITIYHYPVRSHEQFELKVRQGGAAYARNTELAPTVGWHWRRWFAKIERQGVEAALKEALPSQRDIERGLLDGSIVRDECMVEPLKKYLDR